MKIFISWSGDRSKDLAIALREWLPLVLHYTEPWLSDTDIEAGERWGQSVSHELSASNFGLLCVTSDNNSAPWLLFEAGALAKSLDVAKVIPLLLDVEFSDISGPLAQFQAKKVTRAGIEEALRSIQASSEQRIPEDRLKQLFDALWPDLEKKIDLISAEQPTKRKVRSQPEILEELVTGFRGLDLQLRELAEPVTRFGLGGDPRSARYTADVEEISYRVSRGPGDPLNLVIAASALRNEFPWVEILAIEAYREISRGARDNGAFEQLERVVFVLEEIPRRGSSERFHRAVSFLRHSVLTVRDTMFAPPPRKSKIPPADPEADPKDSGSPVSVPRD